MNKNLPPYRLALLPPGANSAQANLAVFDQYFAGAITGLLAHYGQPAYRTPDASCGEEFANVSGQLGPDDPLSASRGAAIAIRALEVAEAAIAVRRRVAAFEYDATFSPLQARGAGGRIGQPDDHGR